MKTIYAATLLIVALLLGPADAKVAGLKPKNPLLAYQDWINRSFAAQAKPIIQADPFGTFDAGALVEAAFLACRTEEDLVMFMLDADATYRLLMRAAIKKRILSAAGQ
jgi:hypothetical protein